MQTLGDLHAHFMRVVKMSASCGVDLSSALDQGHIAADDYADLVTRCRGCAQAESCDRLLAPMPVLEQAPDYCVNQARFADLRGAQQG